MNEALLVGLFTLLGSGLTYLAEEQRHRSRRRESIDDRWLQEKRDAYLRLLRTSRDWHAALEKGRVPGYEEDALEAAFEEALDLAEADGSDQVRARAILLMAHLMVWSVLPEPKTAEQRSEWNKSKEDAEKARNNMRREIRTELGYSEERRPPPRPTLKRLKLIRSAAKDLRDRPPTPPAGGSP